MVGVSVLEGFTQRLDTLSDGFLHWEGIKLDDYSVSSNILHSVILYFTLFPMCKLLGNASFYGQTCGFVT